MFLRRMKSYLASKPVVILMLIGDNAINRWNELICLSDNTSGKPVSLRERFAKDSKDDLFYGSPNIDVAEQVLCCFFFFFYLHTIPSVILNCLNYLSSAIFKNKFIYTSK